MAKRGGGGRSRLDLRREAEAAEAREREKAVEEVEEVEEEDEEAEDAEAEGDADEGDEESPKKKPKKKAVKAKKATVKRVRATKEVRQRAVWVVFDNASKRVDSFPFNQKAEAEALLARKIQEKEGKATFYLNLVKEPLE